MDIFKKEDAINIFENKNEVKNEASPKKKVLQEMISRKYEQIRMVNSIEKDNLDFDREKLKNTIAHSTDSSSLDFLDLSELLKVLYEINDRVKQPKKSARKIELQPKLETHVELSKNSMRWITYNEDISYYITNFRFVLQFNYDIKNNLKETKSELIKLIQRIRPFIDGCIILILSNMECYTIKNIKFDEQGNIGDLDVVYQFDPAEAYPIDLYHSSIYPSICEK